jgi:hypothetical protein
MEAAARITGHFETQQGQQQEILGYETDEEDNDAFRICDRQLASRAFAIWFLEHAAVHASYEEWSACWSLFTPRFLYEILIALRARGAIVSEELLASIKLQVSLQYVHWGL